MICAIPDCAAPVDSQRMCKKHYMHALYHGHITRQVRLSAEARFHAKYALDLDTGCWLWTGFTDKNGYGRFCLDGRNFVASRWSAKNLAGLEIEGKLVCHHCDSPSCVNPEHLFVGLPQDNSSDMVRKGRSMRGERNHQVKFTDAQVEAMRNDPRSIRHIMRDYGVSKAHLWQIKSGNSR